MTTAHLTTLVHHLCRRAGQGDSDRHLLERFLGRGDVTAFADLVARHGPMVLGTCRRILGNAADAEDAFQATFLVLLRRAGDLRDRAALAGWLHGVARRTALKARVSAGRRHRRERRAARPAGYLPAEPADPALGELLHAEIGRLPDPYRSAVVLCYLEGRSYAEAAEQLGCPRGTLAVRLNRARARLQDRLRRRGLTLAAALAAAGTAEAVPPALLRAAGRLPTAAAPAPVAALAGRVQAGLALGTWVPVLVLTLACGLTALAGGLGGGAPQAAAPPPAAAPARPAAADQLAARAWAVLEAVERHHPEPQPRAELIRHALAALCKLGGGTGPSDLDRRAAAVRDRDQLAALMAEVWPAQANGGDPGKVELAVMDGLLKAVPGHPNYFPPDVARAMDQFRHNRYVGIGIQARIDPATELLEIPLPFRAGAAYQGGIRPGDLVEQVDGKPTKGVSLMTIVQWLRGEEGSKTVLVVRTPGAAAPRTVTLTRAPVPMASVLGYRRTGPDTWDHRVTPGGPVAWAWLRTLTSSTLHELRQLERRLTAEGCKALVLDLRGATADGGLTTAAQVADGLLDGGTLWRQLARGQEPQELKADRECLFRGWPLAVLVDGTTQDSALVAIAAALQDNRRAVVVGEATGGGGHLASVVPLPGELGAVSLWTGRLERASGRPWPVQPDQVVTLTQSQRAELDRWRLAKDLPDWPEGSVDRPPADPVLVKAAQVLEEALRHQR